MELKDYKSEIAIKGDSATMIISNMTPYTGTISMYKNAFNCSEPAGGIVVHGVKQMNLTFPADGPVAIAPGYSRFESGKMTICGAVFSFKPVAGAIYKTEIREVTGSCSFKTTVRMFKGDGEYQEAPVELTPRKANTPIWSISEGVCKPMEGRQK